MKTRLECICACVVEGAAKVDSGVTGIGTFAGGGVDSVQRFIGKYVRCAGTEVCDLEDGLRSNLILDRDRPFVDCRISSIGRGPGGA